MAKRLGIYTIDELFSQNLEKDPSPTYSLTTVAPRNMKEPRNYYYYFRKKNSAAFYNYIDNNPSKDLIKIC